MNYTMILIALLTTAAAVEGDTAINLPQLFQTSESGFVDCSLKIIESKVVDGYLVLTLKAKYMKEVVGMQALVSLKIEAGIPGGKIDKTKFVSSGVIFKSIGAESDLLIKAVAKSYGIENGERKMIGQETFTAFALMQEKVEVTSGIYKLKIFGRDGKDDKQENYYESFFNVDMKDGFVYWNEKDQEYRKPLVAGLSGKSAN